MNFCVSISATFTAEPLGRVLSFWSEQLEAHFDVRFALYNQIVQTLLDPESQFATNRCGVNVLLVRTQDLAQDEARVGESAGYVLEAIRSSLGRFSSPTILCSGDDELIAAATGIAGLHVLSHREIESLYPVSKKYDEHADRLGEIPYTDEFFAALGTALARRIVGLARAPYKVIAVDCDNTLWAGVCGEDGPDKVYLDPARRFLHELLVSQRDAGMVLCLVSKNNAEDVMETFRRHPEMPLRLEHFTALRLNWEPKPDNLASIAEELGLALDSFIFIDDSPKECAEVDEAAPEVLALTLPEQSTDIPHFLKHVWAFDHPVITEADRKRAASYENAREFGRAFHSTHSMEEFMASLALSVSIEPVTTERLARVAQLTQRTNQFNFSCERLSEMEVQHAAECLSVEVADRFGDYGLVGAMFLEGGGEELAVTGFLLSCRVLGRGVEHRMLRHVGELAVSRGLATVAVRFRSTERNRPALQFLESIGTAASDCFRFSAESLAGVQWKPALGVSKPANRPATDSPQHRFVPFERIARTLSTTNQIVEAMRSGTLEIDPSMTDIEQSLARIWSDLLKVRSVGLHDRFFDLGGHSLLAVLLLSRVREAFGIELAIDDVYNGSLTLGDLAAKVEFARLSSEAPDDYEAMVAEIEGLSDEEVRALLEA